MLPDLSRYDRVALDTETTGLEWKDRPVGLSWATPDGEAGYLAWGHERGGNNHSLAEVRDWAARELHRPDLLKIFHNAAFDLRMLAYHGILLPPPFGDTATIAPLLNELEPSFSLNSLGQKYLNDEKDEGALNEYCAMQFGGAPTRKAQAKHYWRAPGDVVREYAEQDAQLTLALHDHLHPQLIEEGLASLYQTEIALLPLLLKMHLVGVKVDVARAAALRDKLNADLAAATAEWRLLAGDANPHSTQQVAAVFRKAGLDVNRTERGNDSITADDLKGVDHPLVHSLLRIRRLAHYAGTFIESYLLKNADECGLIHGEFHPLRTDHYGTVSGRFSSGGGLNLQNIPSRDEIMGPLIRGLFVPYTAAQRWLKIDYSQIEFRFFAHYAGGQLRAAYNTDPDVDFHQMVADLTGIERRPAKNINFGLVYGMGIKKLAAELGRPLPEVQEIFAQYHRKLPEVRPLADRAARRAANRGYIRTWGGRHRRFMSAAEAKAKGWHVREHEKFVGTHKALNALLQGSAADLIKRAMVAVAPLIDWETTHLHLTVHDELDLSIPAGAAGDRVTRQLVDVMEGFDLTVPIRAEAEVGPDWGHTEGWEAASVAP